MDVIENLGPPRLVRRFGGSTAVSIATSLTRIGGWPSRWQSCWMARLGCRWVRRELLVNVGRECPGLGATASVGAHLAPRAVGSALMVEVATSPDGGL